MKISGKKIKELRIQKGISQVDMANVADISRSAYIAFENKDSDSISLKSAVGISQKLGISIYDLFEIENSGNVTSEASGELEKLREEVKKLAQRLDEKDLVINSLNSNRKYLVKTLIRYIEDDPSVNWYWIARQGYQYAKTEDEKKIIEDLIKKQELNRIGLYDLFINEGLITPEEIEQVQQLINESYKKINWESTFQSVFSGSKIVIGKPHGFMG